MQPDVVSLPNSSCNSFLRAYGKLRGLVLTGLVSPVPILCSTISISPNSVSLIGKLSCLDDSNSANCFCSSSEQVFPIINRALSLSLYYLISSTEHWLILTTCTACSSHTGSSWPTTDTSSMLPMIAQVQL